MKVQELEQQLVKLTEDPHRQANQKYVGAHQTSSSELRQAIFLFESEIYIIIINITHTLTCEN